VQTDADARTIRLTWTVAARPLTIYADRKQIERLILNLLSNAVKYTPSGGAVEATLDRAGDQVMLIVRDTGYGIPEGELPYIFERFRRVGQLREKASGSGLGLAICKAIVDEHGGQIEVASEVGKGTRFTVYLPVGNAEEEIVPSQDGE
jgi:signal transduction histidine kinase